MKIKSLLLIFLVVFLNSCSLEPQAIEFGVDDCDFCKMTISDERYGAEIVTKKGRVYKFDDVHCLKGFLKEGTVSYAQVHSVWLVNFIESDNLLSAEKSILFQSDQLQSPMGSNTAVFEHEEDIQSDFTGEILTWETYYNTDI